MTSISSYPALQWLGIAAGFVIIGCVFWYARRRKPDPIEDQDYRDEL